MNVKIHIILVLLIIVNALAAQTIPKIDKNTTAKDSLVNLSQKDTLPILTDSLALDGIAVSTDSLPQKRQTVAVSKDSLDSEVVYDARDSMIYDILNEEIHLYGAAKVQYQDINLEADYIIFQWSDNSVTAVGTKDSLGNTIGKPQFSEKDQQFKAEKMRYNFVTSKGIIYDATSTYSDMYILGQTAKFSKAGSDSLAVDDHVYSANARFTTCDRPEPHFCIRSKKQKVVPNKTVVVGPSNLEIAGVPTPIWLPFGFFPIHNQASNGLIFPNDFEYSENFGFGLNEIGWYFPINDHIDLRLTGDIYFLGTHRIRANSRYKKRYKYNGSFNLEYAGLRNESLTTAEVSFRKSISLRWSHNQDSKAHPYRTIGGNINFQTSNHQAANYNDSNSRLNSSMSSNLNYSRRFPNKIFNLSVSATHSQNNQSGDMTINLPVVKFNMASIFPFKSKKPKTKESWYEKISLSYNGEAKNTVTTKDSLLFTKETLRSAQYGARHTFNSAATFHLFKYFRFNPSASYKETWFFKSEERTYDAAFKTEPDIIVVDTVNNIAYPDSSTIVYGKTDTLTSYGWKPVREYSFRTGLSTTLFGTMLFKKGLLRGIRHTVTPSLNFNFTPDYTAEKLGYYKEVRTDYEDPEEVQQYSVFTGGVYNSPSSSGRQMSIGMSLSSDVEIKYYSKKDSTFKKFQLLENIGANWNHNFAADSLRWSNPSVTARTSLFKRITVLNFTSSFTPYVVAENGSHRVFRYTQDKKLFAFQNASLRITNNLKMSQILDWLKKSKEGEQGGDRNASPGIDRSPSGNTNAGNRSGGNIIDNSFLHFFKTFTFAYNLNFNWVKDPSENHKVISTNNLTVRGDFVLTNKWTFRISSIGYDFIRKKVTYPDFTLRRDLHCWEMDFSWRPTAGTYNFGIRVKPSTLGFIDVPYKREQSDPFRF